MSNKHEKLPENMIEIDADDFIMIPLLYSYETGVNNFRPENIEKYIKLYHPSEFKKTHALFALRCTNKNLEPKIMLDELMIIHPQNSAQLNDYVLYDGPFGALIGRISIHSGLNGVCFKDNVSEWHPGKGVDLEIYGKIIAVRREL